MERRSTPRHSVPAHAGASISVTLLSADGGSDVTVEARMEDWSQQGMRLLTGSALRPGTLARINWPDQLALGEVLHCVEIAPGSYRAGLRIFEMLGGLQSLRHLSRRLLGEREPVAAPR